MHIAYYIIYDILYIYKCSYTLCTCVYVSKYTHMYILYTYTHGNDEERKNVVRQQYALYL